MAKKRRKRRPAQRRASAPAKARSRSRRRAAHARRRAPTGAVGLVPARRADGPRRPGPARVGFPRVRRQPDRARRRPDPGRVGGSSSRSASTSPATARTPLLAGACAIATAGAVRGRRARLRSLMPVSRCSPGRWSSAAFFALRAAFRRASGGLSYKFGAFAAGRGRENRAGRGRQAARRSERTEACVSETHGRRPRDAMVCSVRNANDRRSPSASREDGQLGGRGSALTSLRAREREACAGGG